MEAISVKLGVFLLWRKLRPILRGERERFLDLLGDDRRR